MPILAQSIPGFRKFFVNPPRKHRDSTEFLECGLGLYLIELINQVSWNCEHLRWVVVKLQIEVLVSPTQVNRLQVEVRKTSSRIRNAQGIPGGVGLVIL